MEIQKMIIFTVGVVVTSIAGMAVLTSPAFNRYKNSKRKWINYEHK